MGAVVEFAARFDQFEQTDIEVPPAALREALNELATQRPQAWTRAG